MTTGISAHTFVVDCHVVTLEVDEHDAPNSFEVTLHLDGQRVRSFEEPGWRALGTGAAELAFYWWSARRIVMVPVASPLEVEQLDLDEDILLVFRRPHGWLVVCETSVRLILEGTEVTRLEYPDVLTAAHIEGEELVLLDGTGVSRRATITSSGLHPRS